MAATLTTAQTAEAWWRITAWRTDPHREAACPACNTPGLVIEDRSARPHAEWYRLQCRSCGLDETLHLAVGAPPAYD